MSTAPTCNLELPSSAVVLVAIGAGYEHIDSDNSEEDIQESAFIESAPNEQGGKESKLYQMHFI